MSTWAEVVEPSTRALVDEDSDEEFSEPQLVENSTSLELKWIDEATSDIELFVVAYGVLSTTFVTRFICEAHHELAAEVQECNLKESATKQQSATLRKTSSPIYRIKKNVYICVCNTADINKANEFRNAILPLLLKTSQIVVVSGQKSSSFLYDSFAADLDIPFTRCLCSSLYKSQQTDIPYLEQPNIVTGVPAAILSWCEVFNVPGILFCCYSDTNEVNSISAEPLIKIFSSLSTSLLDPSKVKFNKRSYGPLTTNLYM